MSSITAFGYYLSFFMEATIVDVLLTFYSDAERSNEVAIFEFDFFVFGHLCPLVGKELIQSPETIV